MDLKKVTAAYEALSTLSPLEHALLAAVQKAAKAPGTPVTVAAPKKRGPKKGSKKAVAKKPAKKGSKKLGRPRGPTGETIPAKLLGALAAGGAQQVDAIMKSAGIPKTKVQQVRVTLSRLKSKGKVINADGHWKLTSQSNGVVAQA
jgi:hypothetical protein